MCCIGEIENMKSSFNKTIFKEVAESYNENRFNNKRMKKVNVKEQRFAEYVASIVGSNAVMLDIPCGSGRFTEKFKKLRQVYSFDYNYSMLFEAYKNFKDINTVYFAQASITDIPLPDNSVDLVFCMRMMHHIDSIELFNQIIGELARVSSEWIFISFYRNESLKNIRRRILGRRLSGYPISTWSFVKILRNYPFKIKKIQFLPKSQTLVLLQRTRG